MLEDHIEAVSPGAVNPGIAALQAAQKRKHELYIALHADDPGGYLCYDCATDFWNERTSEEFDTPYMKQLRDLNLIPEMSPVRYFPDGDRFGALVKCARTAPPHTRKPDPDGPSGCPILTREEHARMTAFEKRMREVKEGRRMFRTKGDLLGMGPKSVQEGDEVWVLMGAKVPFVLRPVDGGRAPKRYRLVGEAFVLGYMDGEVLEEGREVQTFGLV
jgi:hypothetical protein